MQDTTRKSLYVRDIGHLLQMELDTGNWVSVFA